jgi:hypothetical protein
MRQLYGNEPKKLMPPIKASSQDRDGPKQPQSGGAKFNPGFEHSEDFEEDTFEEKGKPGMFYYKKFVQVLDRHFFGSVDYTLEAKLEFIDELIRYLEAQKGNLR